MPVAQTMFASEIIAVAWEDGDIIIQLPGYLQGFQRQPDIFVNKEFQHKGSKTGYHRISSRCRVELYLSVEQCFDL
jgi:hypothetical protein